MKSFLRLCLALILCLFAFNFSFGQTASIENEFVREEKSNNQNLPGNTCLFETYLHDRVYFVTGFDSILQNSILGIYYPTHLFKQNYGNYYFNAKFKRYGSNESFDFKTTYPINYYMADDSIWYFFELPDEFDDVFFNNSSKGTYDVYITESDNCNENIIQEICNTENSDRSIRDYNDQIFDSKQIITLDQHDCNNLSELCFVNQKLKLSKPPFSNDAIFSFSGLTNQSVTELIPTNAPVPLGMMVVIKGKDEYGTVMDTRTINIQDINTEDFENFSETLVGFGIYESYSAKIFFGDSGDDYCPEEVDLDLEVQTPLCSILELLKHNRDGDRLKWSFDDLQNGLNNLNITMQQAQQYFEQADKIFFTISYRENNGGLKTKTITYTPGTNPIQNLQLTFEPLDFTNLDGKLEISYNYNIDSYQSCNFIPFHYEQLDSGVLEDYECGKTYPLPTPDPANIIIPRIGDVITVNGLTFLVEEINNAGSSGLGTISLPFGAKRLKVSFSNIVVDKNYVLVSGTVDGVAGNPANYPDFNAPAPTLNFGGEICLPEAPPAVADNEFDPVTGLNERGFDSNGTHENGTPYDDNGFNVDGTHINGTKFDDCGCDFESKTADGEDCKPCVNEKDIIEYLNDKQDSIVTVGLDLMEHILDSIQLELNDLDCNTIKEKVRNLADELRYDQTFVFGLNKEYLNEGLSDAFTSPPSQAVHKIEGKNPLTDSLEVNHIKLYYCDELRAIYKNKVLALSISPEELREKLIEKLKTLTLHQVNTFKKDQAALNKWIIDAIDQIIDEFNSEGGGFIDERIDKNLNKPSTNYSSITSTDNIILTEDEKAEAIWMFNQGYTEINGINRGLFLEELAKQMQIEEFLNGTTGASPLPITIKKVIGGVTYAIYVDRLSLTANSASLDAYFVFTPPNSTKKIILFAQNLSFGPGGLLGDVKLKTLNPIEVRLSNMAMIRILPSPDTYVTWSCQGFEAISIKGELELCRQVIIPLNPTTLAPLPDPNRYKLGFQVTLEDWNQFYLKINEGMASKPFAIAGHESIKWTLSDLVVDMSDIQSPSSVNPVPGYPNGFEKTWRGFKLGLLKASLPFKNKKTGKNIEVEVSDLVIDEQGVSAKISANNILAIEDGDVGGWAISLENINIVIIKSKLDGGGIGGKIKVPILKDALQYTATLQGSNNYDFVIQPGVKNTMDMFIADVTLDKTSTFELSYANEEFNAKVSLDGTLDVTVAGTSLKGVTFKKLEVGNKYPYFSEGTWGLGGTSIGFKLFGFGITIKNILLNKTSEINPALFFDCDLELAEELKIKAGGSFAIVGEVDANATSQSYKYKEFNVNAFKIDVKFSAGHISGGIRRFKGNPTYGEGFNGRILMNIKGLGEIQAVGTFGNTSYGGNSNYKYLYIDAAAKIKLGIQAGPLSIDGFTGGVSYHMTQIFAPNNNIPLSGNALPEPGESISGSIRYVPNVAIGLGLKAGALVSLAKSEALFNGSIDIAIEFNSQEQGGGVNNIALNGVGRMMNLPSSLTSSLTNAQTDTLSKPSGETAALSAHLRISYNFDNNTLHGRFITFLDAGPIRGAGTNNKMVDAEVYFGPGKWYIYIGTPNSPCGISLMIPGINVGVSLKAYLDAGSDVPGMPEVPDAVRQVVYTYKPDDTFRKSGAGFVFGASLDLTANIDFGIGSASARVLAGFDVGMKNFSDYTCNGNSIGIDGWYAQGQMYALITGKLTVWGVEILSAGFGTIFKAKFPNPFYASASAGVTAKVGPFKIKKSFTIELGNKCQFISEDPGIGLDVITAMSPDNGSTKVTTDSKIDVEFAVPLEYTFELPQLTGNGIDKYYVKYNALKLTNRVGSDLSYRVEWNAEKTSATFIPNYFFYSNDSITAKLTVDVYKNGVLEGTEIETVSFTTGVATAKIPQSNVETAYPYDGMKNFYKKEYNKYQGFVKLKQNQPEVFYAIEEGRVQNIKFTGENGDQFLVPYNFDPLLRTIRFDMNPDKFLSGKNYTMELLRYSDGRYELDQANPDYHPGSANSGKGTTPLDNANKPTDVRAVTGDQVVLSLKFRVSNYDRFETKVSSATTQNQEIFILPGEKFDHVEISKSIVPGFTNYYLDPLRESPINIEVLGKRKSGEQQFHNCGFTDVLLDPINIKGVVFEEKGYSYDVRGAAEYYLDRFNSTVSSFSFKNNINAMCVDANYPESVKIVSPLDNFDVDQAVLGGLYRVTYMLPDGTYTSTVDINY